MFQYLSELIHIMSAVGVCVPTNVDKTKLLRRHKEKGSQLVNSLLKIKAKVREVLEMVCLCKDLTE